LLRIQLAPAVADRLARFIANAEASTRSGHWERYARLNKVRIEGDCAVVSAGAGFDSEYAFNFRHPSVKQRAGAWLRRVAGRSDLQKYRKAYVRVWSASAPPVHSPHQILAFNYMRYLEPYRAGRYLEIGCGTGYLAAMVRRAWKASVTLIDLPEILPLGFLYMHRCFPDATFALPGEDALGAEMTFLTSGVALAADSFDLAVNTASFGEMPKTVIAGYFRLLRRVLKPGALFFTVNREEKWMDGVPIRFKEYPWLPEDDDLLFVRSPLHDFTQPQNPMLMRLTRLAKCEESPTSRSMTAHG
jgi:SAM-dependent methyltransferase